MAKRQHWLPQFYLRGFRIREAAGSVPRVWTFFRHGPNEPRPMSVVELAQQRYLYAPKDETGTRDHSIDERLQEIETLLGPIWPEIAEGQVDLNEEATRKALSLFVATLYARHPSRVGDLAEAHRRLVELFEDTPKDKDGNPVVSHIEVNGRTHEIDTRGWEAYKHRSSESLHKDFVVSVVPTAGEIARILLRRRWAIVATNVPAFATCDSPLLLAHRSARRVGFNTKGARITLPLSPTRVLTIDDSELPNAYYQSQTGFPEEINYRIWLAADLYLLSSIESHELLSGIVAFGDFLKSLDNDHSLEA